MHVVADGLNGVDFSDAFLHSEIAEVSLVTNPSTKRPEFLAVVHLLLSDCEVEIHNMADVRRFLCDKEDMIVKEIVDNFEATGDLNGDYI